MAKYAIQVKNVKKSFFLPHHKNTSLKSAITQVFKKKEKGGETFKALDGISFNVEKGDFFGILGRNGSGKSTLLKIISEIYQPTSGSVTHDGKLVSFIELGVGFKAELTGRENVYLNGGLLGFSRAEVEAMYDDIVKFAELEQFMDQKLKNYSSGMKVRLAFSVAIRAKADILILDEVLAVGDAAFQKKCTNYFKTLKEGGKTVILVTHGMSNVRKFCNKAIVIDGGQVIFSGDPDDAADEYLRLFKTRKGDKEVRIVRQDDVIIRHTFSSDNDTITLHFEVDSKKDIDNVSIGATIQRDNGAWVYRWANDNTEINHPLNLKKGKKLFFDVKIQNILPDGEYYVDIWAKSQDRFDTYYGEGKAHTFRVRSKNHEGSYWRPQSTYEIRGE